MEQQPRRSRYTPHFSPTRERLHEIIFEADTPLGRVFDISLLVLISFSVIIVMLESVSSLQLKYEVIFKVIEWTLTAIFTVEYLLRLYSVYNPWRYATSFFGIIDLLALLPTYLSFLFAGSHAFIIIRALRLMRIFRILKLGHFLNESRFIVAAMRASLTKITVFLFFIMILVTILGSIMYLIEGGTNEGFASIPSAVYWAIVTLTTVGYGDITPQSSIGQFLSAIVMILGYAIIAVPTGIVTGEIIQGVQNRKATNTQVCRYCAREGHEDDAVFCKYCGNKLNV